MRKLNGIFFCFFFSDSWAGWMKGVVEDFLGGCPKEQVKKKWNFIFEEFRKNYCVSFTDCQESQAVPSRVVILQVRTGGKRFYYGIRSYFKFFLKKIHFCGNVNSCLIKPEKPSSSMVIRDLTLRSAASFGSFHLIRLLYDEYMFYLVTSRFRYFY